MENPIIIYIFENSIPLLCFVVMLVFIMQGKMWHAMYAYTLVIVGYVVLSKIGITEFLIGVVVGVIANEVFSTIRKQLAKESGTK